MYVASVRLNFRKILTLKLAEYPAKAQRIHQSLDLQRLCSQVYLSYPEIKPLVSFSKGIVVVLPFIVTNWTYNCLRPVTASQLHYCDLLWDFL